MILGLCSHCTAQVRLLNFVELKEGIVVYDHCEVAKASEKETTFLDGP